MDYPVMQTAINYAFHDWEWAYSVPSIYNSDLDVSQQLHINTLIHVHPLETIT